jgi:hypothetical protein
MARLALSNLEVVKLCFDILQSFLTCSALIVGGAWTYYNYLHRRERFPRARIAINTYSLETPTGIYVSTSLVIKNTGNLMLTINNVDFRVQQILPFSESYKPSYVPTTDLIGWPLILVRSKEFQKNSLEIEPNEDHQLVFDFILPDHIKSIKIYSFVQNSRKAKSNLGWSATQHYSIPE